MCIRDQVAGVDGGGSRLGDLGQRLLLVGHVVLDGLDEVGDEVVPTLELHVDLAPGVVDLVAPAHQAVVDAGEDDPQDDEDHDLSLIHISEPTRLGMISYAVFCLKKKKRQIQLDHNYLSTYIT